jgi:Fe-S cluster assembly protein SufB
MASRTDTVTEDYKEKYGFSDPVESYAVQGVKGLSERVVQEIVRLHDEPAWMEQIRMKALKHFLDRKPPTWAPDLADIDFQSFYYYARPTAKAADSWEQLPEYIKRTYDKLGITEAEKKFLAGVGAVYECLSGATKVFTTRGFKPISEISEGDIVFSWDESSEKVIPAPVKSKSAKGRRAVFEVRTENNSILATENHPFLVLEHVLPPGHKRRGFWRKRWRYLSELKAGDVVVVPKRLPVVGEAYSLSQPEVYTTTTGHNQFGASYQLNISHMYNEVTLPPTTSPELMWFLGLYIGDGFVHSSTRESGRTRSGVHFLITSREQKLRSDLISSGQMLFGLAATLDDDTVSFNSSILADFLQANGFQTGAQEKLIPRWVWGLPRDQIQSFLAGVIDSDGYASPDNILNITSCNWNLIDQLRDLCRYCGFPVSRIASFKGHDKNGETTNYRFYIYGRFEQIPCKNPQRAARFWRRKYVHTQDGIKGLKLGKYLNEDIGVARITTIKPAGSDDVYDIEINGPHNFVAEGFIVHNSEAVYHSIKGELEKQGVVFTDTVTALKEYPDIMRRYFGTVVPYQDNYIAALQTAVWSAGSFVYVPEGVKVPMILQAYFRINERNMGQFERTLIVAEPYSEVSYNEGCLPAGELVSKGHSFKQIESVGIHELVATHEGRRQAVTHRYIHPHHGQMLTLIPQSSASGFRLTPEHPVLAVKRAKVSIRRSRNGWLPEVSTARLIASTPEFIKAGELEVGDFVVYVAPTESRDDPALTDTLLKILGVYLAEGNVCYNTKLQRDYLSFSFGKSESEKHFAYELVELIRSTGERASVFRSRKRYFTVGSYSKKLIELCRSSCGIGAANKALSERLMLLPPSRQSVLVSYYLKGDGNRYQKKANNSLMIRASTASRVLAFQLQEVLARMGMFANISLRKGSEDIILGRKITRKDQYVVEYTEDKKWSEVRRKGNRFFVPIKEIKSNDFEGPVYNLGVQGDETYLVNGFAVHNCSAPVYSAQSLHSAVVEIIARKGSFVKYTTLQNWSRDVLNLVTKRAHAYEEATVSWVDFNGGSRMTRKYPSVYLLGPRAKADIISVAYAGPGQVQDTGGKAIHLARDTTSKIISRSVSKGGGHTAYRGLLHIAKGAKNVKSTVRCDALLLDEQSTTATYPYMEIQEDDATVTHEASVGKVGEEQLFYLMSRGISEGDALSMVVNGFMEPFAKELPMTYAVEFNRLMSLEMTNAVG